MNFDVVQVPSLVRARLRLRLRVWWWRRNNPTLAALADDIDFDIEREFFNGKGSR